MAARRELRGPCLPLAGGEEMPLPVAATPTNIDIARGTTTTATTTAAAAAAASIVREEEGQGDVSPYEGEPPCIQQQQRQQQPQPTLVSVLTGGGGRAH